MRGRSKEAHDRSSKLESIVSSLRLMGSAVNTESSFRVRSVCKIERFSVDVYSDLQKNIHLCTDHNPFNFLIIDQYSPINLQILCNATLKNNAFCFFLLVNYTSKSFHRLPFLIDHIDQPEVGPCKK